MKNFFITVTLFALCAVNMGAQNRLPANIPTPGATAICKYGDVPMSYYCGTPDITIPLHTFNVRDVELPIYLSYDASGVRLNQLPSWTGENWTLHAGGCITRTINGYPDELIAPAKLQNPTTFYNYFQSYSFITSAINNETQLKQAIENEEHIGRDLEPDVFHFNFMGHSGSFFLGNDGQWQVRGDEDMDILCDIADSTKYLRFPFITAFPAADIDGGMKLLKQPRVISGFTLIDRTRQRRLTGFSISCNNGQNVLYRAFQFLYNNDSTRMHLVGLTERAVGNVTGVERSYKFEYDNYNLLPNNYLSFKTDHWGYCRDISTGGDILFRQMPTSEAQQASFWQQNNPVPSYAKCGSLTSITYPTGGVCDIEYEANRFDSYMSTDRQNMVDSVGYGGGLRVKRLTEYEDSARTQLLSQREFTYIGGELFNKPVYYWPVWKLKTLGSGSIEVTSFSSCSLVPLVNSFGPSVGYSTVIETRHDGAKTVRNYRNLSDSYRDELFVTSINPQGNCPFTRYTEYGYMRGKLLSQVEYDNTGKIVH